MQRIALGALAVLGVLAVVWCSRFQSVQPHPVREITLYATDGWNNLADGSTVYIWGYSTINQVGSAQLPGPTIEAEAGDIVHVRVVNIGFLNRDVPPHPHTLHLHGLDVDQTNDGVPESGSLIPVGTERTYTFEAKFPGTYMYHCHVDTVEHMQMGMYGAVIVRPRGAPERAWKGGPRFDREYTLLLSEVDIDWHRSVADGLAYDRTAYQPEYWLMNGKSFPDTTEDPTTLIRGVVGESILIRLINAGYLPKSMHLHGHHARVIASDGRPIPQPLTKDTILIGPGERYDLLFKVEQPGSYPLHSHSIYDNTNGGAYPGGIHTMQLFSATKEPPNHMPAHSPQPTAASGDVVVIGGLRYIPHEIRVKVGQPVTWLNQEPVVHTITSTTPPFTSGPLEQGQSYSYRFEAAGTYEYYCAVHPSMKGRVIVESAGP